MTPEREHYLRNRIINEESIGWDGVRDLLNEIDLIRELRKRDDHYLSETSMKNFAIIDENNMLRELLKKCEHLLRTWNLEQSGYYELADMADMIAEIFDTILSVNEEDSPKAFRARKGFE